MNDEPVAIDVAAVRSFLARRYPDRERGEQAEVSELVEELFAFGWTNLDDLEAMLDQIADKLLEDEKDDLRDRLGMSARYV